MQVNIATTMNEVCFGREGREVEAVVYRSLVKKKLSLRFGSFVWWKEKSGLRRYKAVNSLS
jgi:hypothetical protein